MQTEKEENLQNDKNNLHKNFETKKIFKNNVIYIL